MENKSEQETSKQSPFTTITPLSKYLAMALFVLLPFVGFYLGMQYQNTMNTNNLSAQNTTPLSSPPNNSTTELPVNEYELTGWLWIGPRAHILVYIGDIDANTGKYILKSGSDHFEPIVLHTETFNAGTFSNVVASPDNTKFIIKRILGDTSAHFLLEVESTGDMVKPTGYRELSFNGSYFVHNNVLGWIDNERIIVKTIKNSETDGSIISTEYWVAPVSNLENKQMLDVN